MGDNKHTRKIIEGLEAHIALHEAKIAELLASGNPDTRVLSHWQKEIRTARARVEALRKRLPNRR